MAKLVKVELNKQKHSCLFGLFYFESFHHKLSTVLVLTLGTVGIQNSLLLSGHFDTITFVSENQKKNFPKIIFYRILFVQCTCLGLCSAPE